MPFRPAQSNTTTNFRPASNSLDGFSNVAKATQPLSNRVSNFFGGKGVSDFIGASLAKTGLVGGLTPEQRKEVSFPTAKEVAGSAIQLGANFIPAFKGASLAGKALAGAATGLAFDVGGNLQQNKEGADMVKPGLGTLTGGILPVLGKLTGLTGVGKNLQKGAQKLEEVNLRLTPVEKQNLEKTGKDIVEYLAKKHVVGTPQSRYAKVSMLYDQMEEQVGNTITGAGVVYKKTDILDSLKDVPEQFVDDVAGYQEAVNKVGSIMKTIQEKFPDEIPAERLNTLKRKLFKRAYSKNNTDVVNDTLHAVASNFKDKLDKSIKGLENLNKEYGLVITAKKALFKAQSRKQTGLVGRALGITAGTSLGGALGGGIGAAGGAIVGERAASTLFGTATRSGVGAAIDVLGKGIDALPTDAAGNISKKALLNYLQSLRVNEPEPARP